jgi:hypothetical protein
MKVHVAGATFLLFAAAGAGCGANRGAVEAPVAAQGKTYPIQFGRPSRAGARAHYVGDHTEDTVTQMARDGAVMSDKHEKKAVHFDAVSTVIAVDGKARATRVRYEVKELTSDGLRQAASVIELTRHAKKEDAEILVDGRPAGDDLRKALSSLLKLGLDGATDDEIFGTKAPQPLGAHWSIDGVRAMASLKEEEGLDVSSVTGDVWLENTTRLEGIECLAVRAKLDIAGARLPDLPAGAETEESRAQAEIRASLPIEGQAQPTESHETITVSFRVRVPAPQGSPMIVTVQGNESQDVRESAM